MASDMTILGCPISSIQSLEAACTVTAIPSCALAIATVSSLDANCCGSLSAYATSVGSCYLAHAPACLDTSAAAASLTAGNQGTLSNPCAAYATGAPVMSSMSSAPSSAGVSVVTTTAGTATATGSSAAVVGSSATGSAATASGTAASTSASTTAKSAAPKINAGLKVYLGVALLGALAVLNL